MGEAGGGTAGNAQSGVCRRMRRGVGHTRRYREQLSHELMSTLLLLTSIMAVARHAAEWRHGLPRLLLSRHCCYGAMVTDVIGV